MKPPLLASFRLSAIAGALALVSPAAHATTVIPPSFNSLVSQSDYIVRAVVTSVTSEMRTDAGGRHIFTLVTLDVRQVIAGHPPQPLVLQILGGKVGNEQMRVEGAPKFEVGDEDILFVHGNGHQFVPLVALMHGRYPVLEDTTGRKYVARSDGRPLYSENDVSLPVGAASAFKTAQPKAQSLSPDDFVSRIHAAITANARSKLEN